MSKSFVSFLVTLAAAICFYLNITGGSISTGNMVAAVIAGVVFIWGFAFLISAIISELFSSY